MNLASRITQTLDRGFYRGADLGIEALAKVLGGNTDAQSLHRLIERADIIRHGQLCGSRVQGIMPCNHPQKDGGVAHRACQRTDAVKRGGKGDQAVARYASIGWEYSDDPAERCGLANRSPGVGTEGS